MNRKHRHKRTFAGWILSLLLLLFCLVFGFHLFSFSELSHRVFSKRVQYKVLKADDRLQQCKTDLLYAFDQFNYVGTLPALNFSLPRDISLLIYHNDSLVYWTDNRIEPKLLRKRLENVTDTILDLNCGDYLVSSFQYGPEGFYLYTLLNTHYPIENEYFINRFQAIPGRHKILFSNENSPSSYPVYSRSGLLLSYFDLAFPSLGNSSNIALLTFCLIGMLLCVYLLILRGLLRHQRKKPARTTPLSPGKAIGFIAVLLVAYTAIAFLYVFMFRWFFQNGFFIPAGMRLDNCLLVLFMASLLVVSFVLVFMHHFRRFFNDRGTIFVTFVQFVLLGILLTTLYDSEYQKFENNQVRELTISLSVERDPSFENSYRGFVDAARNDTVFHAMILSEDVMDVVVKDYMRNFLFDSVMNRYNVSVTLCNPGLELVLQPYDFVENCDQYFLSKVTENDGALLGNGLYFVDYNTLDPNYLGAISISLADTLDISTVYLEFSKPIAPQGYGLSNTLRDEHSMLPKDYSVACYRDSLLVYKVGSYMFPNYLSDYHHDLNVFSYGKKLKHYVHQSDDSKVVAVCLNRRNWMELTSPFMVFFLSLLLLYWLVYFVVFRTIAPPLSNSLSRRFQVMVWIVLSISFLVVGPVSVIYMKGLYTQKTEDFHFERTRTLLLDITGEVDFSFLKQPGFRTMLDDILKHYSETFFTDINIYGLDGKMLATTTPEMIDMRLQSSLMNAEAFQNMQGEKSLYYIHDESLGKAVYQSAYISIQDEAGKTMAYLNTPYFTSQSALRVEVINYVLTYINIITLIILLSLPLVLFSTRRITYPLTQLQDKMRQVDINKTNEKIEWKSKDEIGALIKQYNQLVVELEKSAAELRRTAAESAWRGVARQVAHEIKNSLTPMRLSVQMLQRSMENGSADLNEHTKRTTATLIEQIDALSDIASSFSTYAKLPENHPAPLDLAELVGNVVNLYDNEENITFQYTFDATKDHTFNGDKTNLNSAIGNLVKNAAQAIGTKPVGRIEVVLEALEDGFVISIKDNGKGIKEEDKKMIFVPNFTTKTGGSGVGLSLTYNIIQAAGGTITFESEEGVGTEFKIFLKK